MTKEAEPSEFTRKLLGELDRNGYSLSGWREFLADSWSRSLADITSNPALTRSFLRVAVACLLAGGLIVAMSWWYQSATVAVWSIALWQPWYGISMAFVLTHLGMADRGDGVVNERFSAPNQLTFARLSLAPLVMLPGLVVPASEDMAFVLIAFIIFLSVTDVLDGWLARRHGAITRLGRTLDYIADLAFLIFLAFGLLRADMIPLTLFGLIVVRYPLSLVAALVMYFAKGPIALSPTVIGRVTTLLTSVLLLLLVVHLQLGIDWPSHDIVASSIVAVQLLIGINIAYLIVRGVIWAKA